MTTADQGDDRKGLTRIATEKVYVWTAARGLAVSRIETQYQSTSPPCALCTMPMSRCLRRLSFGQRARRLVVRISAARGGGQSLATAAQVLAKARKKCATAWGSLPCHGSRPTSAGALRAAAPATAGPRTRPTPPRVGTRLARVAEAALGGHAVARRSPGARPPVGAVAAPHGRRRLGEALPRAPPNARVPGGGRGARGPRPRPAGPRPSGPSPACAQSHPRLRARARATPAPRVVAARARGRGPLAPQALAADQGRRGRQGPRRARRPGLGPTRPLAGTGGTRAARAPGPGPRRWSLPPPGPPPQSPAPGGPAVAPSRARSAGGWARGPRRAPDAGWARAGRRGGRRACSRHAERAHGVWPPVGGPMAAGQNAPPPARRSGLRPRPLRCRAAPWGPPWRAP
jgi:hypothetical protein